MIDEILLDAEDRMEKAVATLRADLLGIRTGRATPALLDRVRVEAYSSVLPLNQVATVAVPEPRLITIRPYDVSTLGAIERAILKSDLGLNPNNDGKIIRLAVPPLTDQRRQELARMVNRRVEESRVAIRNLRREALRSLTDLEKDGEISEDDLYKSKEDLQKVTDEYTKRADELGEQKQAEILEF